MRPRTELKAIAATRDAAHRGMPHDDPSLNPNGQYMGVVGEATFEAAFGFEMDTAARPAGDGGWDFDTPAGRVDVKTFAKPRHLLLAQHEAGRADIYVLAGWEPATQQADLLGWQYGGALAGQPVRDFGRGYPSHYMRATDLLPMESLHWLISELRGCAKTEG